MIDPIANDAVTPVDDWLTRSHAWLTEVRIAGLADPSESLCTKGRILADEAALLGWSSVARLLDRSIDAHAGPHERAQAWLDLTAWLATARRLQTTTSAY